MIALSLLKKVFKLKSHIKYAGFQSRSLFNFVHSPGFIKRDNYVGNNLTFNQISHAAKNDFKLLEDLANICLALKGSQFLNNRNNIHQIKYMLLYTLVSLEYTSQDYLDADDESISSDRNILAMINNIRESYNFEKDKYKSAKQNAQRLRAKLKDLLNG